MPAYRLRPLVQAAARSRLHKRESQNVDRAKIIWAAGASEAEQIARQMKKCPKQFRLDRMREFED